MWLAANHPQSVRRLVLWGIPILPKELHEQFLNEEAPVFDDEGQYFVTAWKRAKAHLTSLSTAQLLDNMIGRLQMKGIAHWIHHALAKTDFVELATKVSPCANKQPVGLVWVEIK
jgi:pimeloyl-ACP methyl ester carboxylesterase